MSNQNTLQDEFSGASTPSKRDPTVHVVCRDCPDLEELVSSDWTANAFAFDHEQDEPDHTVAFGVVA